MPVTPCSDHLAQVSNDFILGMSHRLSLISGALVGLLVLGWYSSKSPDDNTDGISQVQSGQYLEFDDHLDLNEDPLRSHCSYCSESDSYVVLWIHTSVCSLCYTQVGQLYSIIDSLGVPVHVAISGDDINTLDHFVRASDYGSRVFYAGSQMPSHLSNWRGEESANPIFSFVNGQDNKVVYQARIMNYPYTLEMLEQYVFNASSRGWSVPSAKSSSSSSNNP